MNNSREIISNETMSEAIGEISNYHDWVFDSFKDYICKGTALEVGAGHGIYSKKIAEKVQKLIISDIDPQSIADIKKKMNSFKNISYLVMDGIDRNQISFRIDTIILINIMEHMENDKYFLEQCFNILNKNGRIIIFVPAFQCLFSEFDKKAGHYRRYDKNMMKTLLNSCFEIEKMQYFNKFGFFGWMLNKFTASRIHSKSTKLQILIYDKLIPVIKYLDFLIPFVGQSLIVISKKRMTHAFSNHSCAERRIGYFTDH